MPRYKLKSTCSFSAAALAAAETEFIEGSAAADAAKNRFYGGSRSTPSHRENELLKGPGKKDEGLQNQDWNACLAVGRWDKDGKFLT